MYITAIHTSIAADDRSCLGGVGIHKCRTVPVLLLEVSFGIGMTVEEEIEPIFPSPGRIS
jgi:hypothetical protein